MANKGLTALQADFLSRFFASETAQTFFLTGGTALAAYHLHHRTSVDLELFTLDDFALREVDIIVPQIAAELNCKIGLARRSEHFRQFLLESGAPDALQLDFVRDFGPQYGEHTRFDNIIVDSVENIGANKITAILGRTEPKDFVDLYFILDAGYNFDDLLQKATEKDLGLQPFFLAASLLQVKKLHYLPETEPALELGELQSSMVALAESLIDRSKPPE